MDSADLGQTNNEMIFKIIYAIIIIILINNIVAVFWSEIKLSDCSWTHSIFHSITIATHAISIPHSLNSMQVSRLRQEEGGEPERKNQHSNSSRKLSHLIKILINNDKIQPIDGSLGWTFNSSTWRDGQIVTLFVVQRRICIQGSLSTPPPLIKPPSFVQTYSGGWRTV